MNQAASFRTQNPILFAWFYLAFLSAVVAYVLPVYVEVGNVAVYWLAFISSFAVAGYVACYLQFGGRLEYRTTTIDLVVMLYVIWILISFFANAVLNIATGNVGYLGAQVQSLVVFFLMLLHYAYGRFSNALGLSLDRLFACVAPVYVVACLAFIGFTLWTGNLYLARMTTGQRDPMLIVFWAWLFCGLWISARKPWYSVAFLAGTVACALSLTRGAYLQWVATAFCMLLAVGTTKMLKHVLSAMAILAAATLITWHYSDPLSGLGDIVISRVVDLTFAEGVVETETSASFRVRVWENIADHLVEHPWSLVFGYGQMGSSYLPVDFPGSAGEIFRGTSSHSQYLDTLVRAGIPGLALELLVGLYVIVVPLFTKFTPVRIKIIAACLSGHLVYGVFHESIRWQVFGIVFWFFAGIVAQSVQDRDAVSRKLSVREDANRVPELKAAGPAQ